MNVIANAFAFKEEYGNSMQLVNKSDDEKLRIYMKNVVVSLVSAKKANPSDEVMLVTNGEIMEPYKSLLMEAGVKIAVVPFDRYIMPQRFSWALAFYKLRALEYLANETEYEKVLLIDTDTVSVSSFSDIWQEAEHGLMLCPVNHTYSHPERDKIRKDYVKLYPNDGGNLIHYGGEFICATRTELSGFMKLCESVYARIVDSDYDVVDNIGDETILAIAAILYKRQTPLTEAGAYLYRYWTEKRFYLISTNHTSNPICIWHLPSEKDRGMLVVFDYYARHKEFPCREKLTKMFALQKAKRPLTFWSLLGRYRRFKSK